MTPEQSELVKRLRMHEMRGAGPGVNEDCGEAADTIATQASEIARLRAVTEKLLWALDNQRDGDGPVRQSIGVNSARREARAALNGEKP